MERRVVLILMIDNRSNSDYDKLGEIDMQDIQKINLSGPKSNKETIP